MPPRLESPQRPSLTRHLGTAMLLGLALILAGAVGGPTADLDPTVWGGEASIVAQLGGLGPLCEPTNANGCTFTDIVCNGYSCCCVYSCAGGGNDVGPCQSSNPFL